MDGVKKEITQEKIEDYLNRTRKAIDKIKIIVPEGTHNYKIALDYLDMAQRYLSDAQHFYNCGDFVNAFACVNYAHGWLDAGARIGFFDVEHDSNLFTVD